MQNEIWQHCTEDALELYSLGRISDSGIEVIEEHLLICEPCQRRLENTDRYVRAMRRGAARLRDETAQARMDAERSSLWARFAGWFRIPAVPVWAGAAALVCGLGLLMLWPRNAGVTGAPLAVSLVAERGSANAVSANHPLNVTLDARGLELGSSAHLELVDAAGARIEDADAPVQTEKIRAFLPKPLKAGDYYLRIFKTRGAEAVREFALQVQ